MIKIAVVAVALLATVPALACDPATHNAMRDQAQAAEKQAEALQRLERIERDRLRLQERAQRNANR
jgi:hypothetical protein